MKKSIFIALIIVIAATLWILSGVLGVDSPKTDAPSETNAQHAQPKIPQVRVKTLSATTMDDEIEVTGRTQASRQVVIRAETEGSIALLNIKKGQPIQKGATIAKLRVKDRGAQLEQAQQLLKQREIQYKASKELAEKGYNSRVRLAEKKAELGSARAQVKQAQEELSNIVIKAPFGGIINQQMVEIGDYVTRGSDIIEVVNLNPIEITGFLTEKQINNIKQGQPIAAKLLSGEVVEGKITFIAAAANKDTRTFEIEMTVPNDQGLIKEGLTAKILVPFKQDKAYKISPSILSLTDDGRIGVKTVNQDNKVEFKPVTLLKDTPNYLWINGLPDQVRLITVGQEFVNDGQIVDPIAQCARGQPFMIAPVIDAALSRSRTVLSVMIFLLIAGIYAYINIPKESSPDINIPILYVSMSLEGISPDDAERLLLRPMEQEVSSIEGIKKLKSTGYTGGGFVILEFQAGFDKDSAMDDVQKAVDRAKGKLPDTLDRDPEVTEVNFSLFPVLVVTLSGDVPERTLVKISQDLQDKIEGIGTVLEANISGDREELVEIIVDPILLESYGLRGSDILQFFSRSNRLVAAGDLDTGVGRFAVKVPGLFEDATDIMEMPLRTQGDSVIKVRDVAEIRQTFKDPQNFARINGQRAVALNVVKRTGENIIETIEAVQQLVDQEKGFWPNGVEVVYTLDQSDDIRQRLSDLQNNMISAVLLVMVVVIAIMGIRAAGLVGVAIPSAFLSGVLILFLMGLTVNVVVLFGLILSVGMLVDGAIVVTELADRNISDGMHKKQAYANAAKTMAWPITASTATTLAAFAPLLFWPGIVGQFMQYMPITLIAVLGSSLFVALIFVPVMGSIFGKTYNPKDKKDVVLSEAQSESDLKVLKGPINIYIKILSAALKISGIILIMTVILLISVQTLYGKFGKGVEFFPNIEPKAASVLIHARGNLSVYEQNKLVKEVEDHILDIKGIKVFYTEAGKQSQQGGNDIAADVIGTITVEFESWDKRKSAQEILDDIRDATQEIAGINVEAQVQEEGPPSGKAVQIEVASRFPDTLNPAVDMIVAALRSDEDFIDIEDSRPLPGIEWEMQVDRAQASKFGVDISLIGDYVRMVTNGLKVTDYRPDGADDDVDIVIRHSKEQRTLDQLDRVRIETNQGSVPISNFVNRVPQPAVGTINRVNQNRVFTIKANVKNGVNINEKVVGLKEQLVENRDKFDPRVQINFTGEDEDQMEAQQFLMKAFVIALFAMAVILVTQFNSFYSALLILFAVVMSTIGVMIGLLITGQPFGIVMSGIGIIALAGIVVNNNIVLIDTFDNHIKRGLKTRDAILITGAQRLRPVLLTTVTTILGLMPMVLQLNIDFINRIVSQGAPSTQWWVQLSTAIVFGLTFSTILTLIVTPSALMFREKAGKAKNFAVNKIKNRI